MPSEGICIYMATFPTNRKSLGDQICTEHARGLVTKLDELNARNLTLEDEQKEAERHVNELFEKRWEHPVWKRELMLFAGAYNRRDREGARRSYLSAFLHELQDGKNASGKK